MLEVAAASDLRRHRLIMKTLYYSWFCSQSMRPSTFIIYRFHYCNLNAYINLLLTACLLL